VRSDETVTSAPVAVSSLLTSGNYDSITVTFIATGTNPATSAVRPLLTFIDSTTAATDTITSTVAGGTAKVGYVASESATAGTQIVINAGIGTAQVVGASFRLTLESATASVRKAGAYNYLIIAEGYSGGVKNPALTQTAAAKITIDAAAVAVPAAGNATAYILPGTAPDFGGIVADVATSGSFVAGTTIGKIQVSNKTSLGAAAADTITVSMTGSGTLANAATTGRSFEVSPIATETFSVIADGTSGTGTITITTGAGASFVKTVTFFDTKPAKVAATVEKAYIKAGTTNVTGVFAVSVTDTLGNNVSNAVITAAPTDTATTVGGAATCLTYNSTDKVYYCGVKGLSTTKFGPVAYTITATGGDTAKTVLKTTATVTFADNVATKAVLAGPATATPGQVVEYTLTLTEKNGYPVADQDYGVSPASGGALFAKDPVTSGWTTAPFLSTESFTSVSGVITVKATTPLAGKAMGTWTLVGDGLQTLAANAIDKTIGKTTLTVSTDVANPGLDAATDAANEATDAANAATDAALAAAEAADAATTAAQEASDAVAALSESVTKLIAGLQAQIKSLAAVVAKIAKKVKA